MYNKQMILINFVDFIKSASSILFIKNVNGYQNALDMTDHLVKLVGEDDKKPENLLIDLISEAIECYEINNKEVCEFINQAKKIQSNVSLVRLIIDHHHLTLSDLPEIGSKSIVSKILSEDKKLTKSQINKLSKRFNLNPDWFF